MANLTVWLMALIQPILAKVLLAIGFSVVTITGMDAILNQLRDSMVTNINAMPAVWLDFALYLWIGKGLGIVFGAMATKLMLWTIQQSTSILGKAPA